MGDQESDKSISELVQEIMDQLSERVSQVTLIVIQKRDRNEPMPPTLKGAVGAVGKAATLVVQVARSLAESDYADFANIQREINDACQAVEQSTTSLLGAIGNESEELHARWQRLADSCKVIANKTIVLLQIVYGAETRKILEAADRARESCNRLRHAVRDASLDPKNFADAATRAGTDTNALAAYVREKAEGENPFRKSQMERAANDLEKQSAAIVDTANALLKDPKDTHKQDAVRNEVGKTNAAIDRATQPIKADLPEMNDNDYRQYKDKLNELKSLLPEVAGLANSPKSDEEKIEVLERVQALVRDIANGIDNPEVTELSKKIDNVLAAMMPIKNGKKTLNKDILQAAEELAGLMGQVVGHAKAAAHKKRVPAADRAKAEAELDRLLATLDTNVRQKANINTIVSDIDRIDEVVERKKELAGLVGRAVEEAKQGIATATKSFATTGDPLVDSCNSIMSLFEQLSSAATRGSCEDLLVAGRTISSEVQDMISILKREADKCQDPADQAEILKHAAGLKNLIVQLKILVSVKAAGSSEQLDQDEQLACVLQQIGRGMKSSVDAVYVGRLRSPRKA